MGVDFSIIGDIVANAFDNDLMDIGRRMEITNPDGSTGETKPDEPIYTNVPCHITFDSTDNPNPNAIDTSPIIVSITIHCPTYIDIQNGDYVYAHKMSQDREILKTYTGLVGFPTINMSRQTVLMSMSRDV